MSHAKVIQCEREPTLERDGTVVLLDRRVQRESSRKLFASEESSQRRQGFRPSGDESGVASWRCADVAEYIECDGIREPIDAIRLIRALYLEQNLAARDVDHRAPQANGVGAFRDDRSEQRQTRARASTQVSCLGGIRTPPPAT